MVYVGCLLAHMICSPSKFKCNSFVKQSLILATYFLTNYVNYKIQHFSNIVLRFDFKVLLFVLWRRRFGGGEGRAKNLPFMFPSSSLLCISMTPDFMLVRAKDYLHCEWLLCPFIWLVRAEITKRLQWITLTHYLQVIG